jgi:hypothetical protein
MNDFYSYLLQDCLWLEKYLNLNIATESENDGKKRIKIADSWMSTVPQMLLSPQKDKVIQSICLYLKKYSGLMSDISFRELLNILFESFELNCDCIEFVSPLIFAIESYSNRKVSHIIYQIQ